MQHANFRATALVPMVVTVLFLAGCSPGPKITHDYDNEANIASYKTWDFHKDANSIANQTGTINQLNVQRLTRAVMSEMEAKGYPRNAENPDFLVVFHYTSKDKMDVYNTGYVPAYRPWGSYSSIEVDEYTEGTLILDFVDASNDMMFWRGTAVDKDLNSGANAEREINEVVPKILAGYPPK